MDMTTTMMLLEDVGFRKGRERAINYYVEKWGWEPSRSVRVDTLFARGATLLTLGVITPLIVIGRVHKDPIMVAWGFTISACLFTSIQLLRPLAANVYSLAAYRYTELGKNDIWTRFPGLAPSAYKGKMSDDEEEDLVDNNSHRKSS